MVFQKEFIIEGKRKGCHLITQIVEAQLPAKIKNGILHVFLKHTSAALTLNENADPSVRVDIDNFLDDLIPDDYSNYTHTMEGLDDMPAHIKTSLLGNSLSIPITNGRLNLGTWQGIYLCEFRNYGGPRKIYLTVLT